MPLYFLDSSAVVKHYHPEPGSDEVNRLLTDPASRFFISRLGVVEVQRAFVGKVRSQAIAAEDLDDLRQGFLKHVNQRRFEVIRLTDEHYRTAERLVNQYGPGPAGPLLRSLDALQLAVALDIRTQISLDTFVSADKRQCEAAAQEGFTVINPAP